MNDSISDSDSGYYDDHGNNHVHGENDHDIDSYSDEEDSFDDEPEYAVPKRNFVPLLMMMLLVTGTFAFVVVTYNYHNSVRVRSTTIIPGSAVDDTTTAVVTVTVNTSLVRTTTTGAAGLSSSSNSTTVCGVKRTVAIANISQLLSNPPAWELLDDKNKGDPADSTKDNNNDNDNGNEYDTLCNAEQYFYGRREGEGKLRDYAIGKCTDPKGCRVWRVFDIPPAPQQQISNASSFNNGTRSRRSLNSRMKGGFWLRAQDLYDDITDDGKSGKTLAQFAQDVGICQWRYPSQEEGETGGAGGYLAKCKIPTGHLFAFGPGQSMTCVEEQGENEVLTLLPQSETLQLYIDTHTVTDPFLTDCSYCETQEYNSVTRDAPDVTACTPGTTKQYDLFVSF